jgi:flagellar secretion chaperone FliS
MSLVTMSLDTFNLDARAACRQGLAGSESPVQLVIPLYEQAAKDVTEALKALRAGDIERRTFELDHAFLVIGQLQATLDMEHGGEVARNLERIYTLVRSRLLQAQIQASAEILEEQIGLLLSLRETWQEVERRIRETPAPPEINASASPPAVASANWRA